MDTEDKDKREVPAEIDGTPAVARFVRVAAGALAVLVLLVGGFIFFRLHSDSMRKSRNRLWKTESVLWTCRRC